MTEAEVKGQATYTIRPLDMTTWDAWADLVERNGGVFGGCWCIGFHPEAFGKSVAENRERKLRSARARRTRRWSSTATRWSGGVSSGRRPS